MNYFWIFEQNSLGGFECLGELGNLVILVSGILMSWYSGVLMSWYFVGNCTFLGWDWAYWSSCCCCCWTLATNNFFIGKNFKLFCFLSRGLRGLRVDNIWVNYSTKHKNFWTEGLSSFVMYSENRIILCFDFWLRWAVLKAAF